MRRRHRALPLCAALLLLTVATATAQMQAEVAAVRCEDFPAVSRGGTTLAGLVLPRAWLLQHRLRADIAALERPACITGACDLRRLDAIWERALYLADGDAQDALLAAAMATLPYRRFPARLPLIGLVIIVPVSSEGEQEFQHRLSRLPGLLFADTPADFDRDKLPHFFGSAWLQLLMHEPDAVLAAGHMVEILEGGFKLDGALDARDLRADRLGALFARTLQRGHFIRPSQMFLRYDALRARHGHAS
jgi:hypothetical protein